MAALASPSSNVPLFLLFLNIICFLSHQFHHTVAKPTTGFSLKLIHRDSPHSPLYPGNLSSLDQIRRLIEFSDSRVLQLESVAANNTSSKTLPDTDHPDIIRPPVDVRGFVYVVQLSVGTPPKPYYLILDTASALIWTQCLPCESPQSCFPQKEPTFNPRTSSTYTTLPCSHPFCKGMDCVGGKCIYEIKYANQAITKGTLSRETFTFLSNNGAIEHKKGIVFGCSNNNQHFTTFRGEIDGILGMSYAALSLTAQIRDEIKKRFSYCFVQSGIYPPHHSSFLRFGDDIVIKGGSMLQTTPFVRYRDTTMYALNLTDISIGSNPPIGFPPGTFALKQDGTGGCLIDSGAAISYLETQPYQRFRQAMMHHFEQYLLRIIPGKQYNLDLCYHLPRNFHQFPSLTFHLEGAYLTVPPINMFIIDYGEQYFCLAMKPKNGYSTIGAMQQQNIRFVYDIGRRVLSFAPEDCSKDAE